ncbi:MAG TPA: MraY family glycosyltransferase [Magnetospirillum sp.]|nr:MraY family glycosyltransferase [Magnetospirillum sp.]
MATYSAYFLNAFLLSLVAMPPLMLLAKRVGLLDVPNSRKLHAGSIPVVGGIAIFFAVGCTFLQMGLSGGPIPSMLPGLAVLVVVGIVDDRQNISAGIKLAGQTVAALVMIIPGEDVLVSLGNPFGTGPMVLGTAALPLTVFFMVAVINAFNLIDGIDGLAGSLAVVALSWQAYLAVGVGDMEAALVALVMVFAILGFLVYNLRHPWRDRADVFLGDAGSMMLGACVAMLTVRLSQRPSVPEMPLVALCWIIALPAIDMVSVMVRRMLAGRTPFSADRRHLHHLLVDRGVPLPLAVMMCAGSATLLGAIGVTAWQMAVPERLMLVGLVMVAALHSLVVKYGFRGEHLHLGPFGRFGRRGR